MKKLTKSTKKLLSITLFFVMLFSLFSCSLPWEEERNRIFEEIDKIGKSSDYAIVTSRRYVSATEEIDFADIVREKVLEDGHKIKNDKSCKFYKWNGLAVFSYLYKSEKRFWGINNSNNCWAVGTISLDDFSIEIHYLKNKYEYTSIINLSQTHLCFKVRDENAKKETDQYGNEIIEYDYTTLNRVNEELHYWEDSKSALEVIGEPVEGYKNPNTFVYNGKTYTISGTIIRDEKGETFATLNGLHAPFEYSDVLLVSSELQEINKILGEGDEYCITSYFFTNGEDLFVGFVTEMTKFGVMCNLTCPVIFKTNLDFDSFEYIGCVSQDYMNNFYEQVEVRKIN